MIKNFNEYNNNYKVGDWIILKDQGWQVIRCCKIIQIESVIDYHSYKVEALKDKEKWHVVSVVEFWIKIDEIERLATEEEKNKTEMLIKTIEYNL